LNQDYCRRLQEVLNELRSAIDLSTELKIIDFSTLEADELIGKLCFNIFDLVNWKILYISAELYNLLGYKREKITYKQIFESIHPEDKQIVKNATVNSFIAVMEHPEIDWSKNIFIIDYRIKKADGNYIRILRRSCVFKKAENGLPHLAFSQLVDISKTKRSDVIYFYFEGQDIDQININSLNKVETKEEELNPGEIRVLRYIARGKKNKEIALLLYLSIHTIRTHRSNLMRKLNARNSVELINIATRLGYI
jgi:DNA-binding CsgD family transcriptional regulator